MRPRVVGARNRSFLSIRYIRWKGAAWLVAVGNGNGNGTGTKPAVYDFGVRRRGTDRRLFTPAWCRLPGSLLLLFEVLSKARSPLAGGDLSMSLGGP